MSTPFIIGGNSIPVYDNNFPHAPNTGNCKQNIVNECSPINDNGWNNLYLQIIMDNLKRTKLPIIAKNVVSKKEFP